MDYWIIGLLDYWSIGLVDWWIERRFSKLKAFKTTSLKYVLMPLGQIERLKA